MCINRTFIRSYGRIFFMNFIKNFARFIAACFFSFILGLILFSMTEKGGFQLLWILSIPIFVYPIYKLLGGNTLKSRSLKIIQNHSKTLFLTSGSYLDLTAMKFCIDRYYQNIILSKSTNILNYSIRLLRLGLSEKNIFVICCYHQKLKTLSHFENQSI